TRERERVTATLPHFTDMLSQRRTGIECRQHNKLSNTYTQTHTPPLEERNLIPLTHLMLGFPCLIHWSMLLTTFLAAGRYAPLCTSSKTQRKNGKGKRRNGCGVGKSSKSVSLKGGWSCECGLEVCVWV
ncbi:unnamed protein product, partial [Ceratitis capitata]